MGAKFRPLLGSLWVKSAIVPWHYHPAAHIFIGPSLRYAAEFSVSRDWERCLPEPNSLLWGQNWSLGNMYKLLYRRPTIQVKKEKGGGM